MKMAVHFLDVDEFDEFGVALSLALGTANWFACHRSTRPTTIDGSQLARCGRTSAAKASRSDELCPVETIAPAPRMLAAVMWSHNEKLSDHTIRELHRQGQHLMQFLASDMPYNGNVETAWHAYKLDCLMLFCML